MNEIYIIRPKSARELSGQKLLEKKLQRSVHGEIVPKPSVRKKVKIMSPSVHRLIIQ